MSPFAEECSGHCTLHRGSALLLAASGPATQLSVRRPRTSPLQPHAMGPAASRPLCPSPFADRDQPVQPGARATSSVALSWCLCVLRFTAPGLLPPAGSLEQREALLGWRHGLAHLLPEH